MKGPRHLLVIAIGVGIALALTADGQTNTFPSSGKVGIGTGSPTGELTISGVGGSATSDGLEFFSDGNSSGYSGWVGRIYAGSPPGGWATAPFIFSVPDGSGSEIVTLTLLNGNVGIGNSSPGATLDVTAPSASYLGLRVLGEARVASAGSTDDENISLKNGTRQWNLRINGGADAFSIRDITSGSLDRLTILNNGNIGIGTATPSCPLSVNGTIEAKEVLVQTGWSDYVFDEGYQLAPLSDVEREIKTQRHLPGMPSAQEVATHGISLGNMEAKLLAQIEQLTLRQIDQEEKIKALEAQNLTLNREVAVLKESFKP